MNMKKRKHSRAGHLRRKKILGMSTGRAGHRLKKAIMFDMAAKLGLLQCFRCSQPISIDEFSIDHKVAWEGASDPITTFFSLENIAFSHFKCNTGAGIRHKKYVDAKARNKAKAERQKHPDKRARQNFMRRIRRTRYRQLGVKPGYSI